MNINIMSGWKVWSAAAVITASALLQAFDMADYSKIVFDLGVALGIVGLGHKVEKGKVADKIKMTRAELKEILKTIRERNAQ